MAAAAAANSQIRGLAAILGKRFIAQIRSRDYPRTITSLSHLSLNRYAGACTTQHTRKIQRSKSSPLVSDDVNPPKPEQYWGPNPKTGVFGPASNHNPGSGGEGGSHASASEESVLEKKTFFRPLEDLEKPDQP